MDDGITPRQNPGEASGNVLQASPNQVFKNRVFSIILQEPEDMKNTMNKPTEIATLAGGCFWCLETVYAQLKGVIRVESGYAGGSVPNPTYAEVCTGQTGHAEVVQITYDPGIISYKELLEVFFTIHDPTTLNRQGADVGTQYRSAIFYHTPEQKALAEQTIQEMDAAHLWLTRIVTQVVPFTIFYKAEDYHQNYYQNNPSQGYCQVVIAPKVAKFRKKFFEKLIK
jgi:peptide-methionine (S)-S-oxide reductase